MKKFARLRTPALLIVALFCLHHGAAQAATLVWVGGDGAWEEPTNWDTGSIPVAGDSAYVSNNAGTARITATTGNVPISGSLSGMRVAGAGRSVIQTGGAVSMSSTLYLGGTGGGTYELQDGTLNVGYFMSINEFNASSQIANFTQSGGTSTFANVRTGQGGNGAAYITVTDGALNVSGNGNLTLASGGGSSDTAWLTQSGGTVTIGGQLQLGTGNPVSGTRSVIVNLDGGVMTIKGATPLSFVGGTVDYFDFDGGTLNLKGTWDFAGLDAIENSDYRVRGVAATADDFYFTPIQIEGVDYTQITLVPEPSTMILAGLGLAGLTLRRRRR